MTYQVELRPVAVRALKRIDHQDRDRIRGAIVLLGEDPRPPGAKSIQGRPGLRVRTGDYRIIYTVEDNILVVAVIKLGHRSNLYERCLPSDESAVGHPGVPQKVPVSGWSSASQVPGEVEIPHLH